MTVTLFLRRYESILTSIRDDLEMRDVGHFYSLLYKGSVEECGGEDRGQGGGGSSAGRKKKIRKGLSRELYLSARRHPEFREIVEMFSVSAADLGDAIRYGGSLKVRKDAVMTVLED
jgi:hypothetical protein